MDVPQVVTSFGIAITSILGIWVVFAKKFDRIDERFEKVEAELKSHGERLAKIEEGQRNIEAMLQTILGALLGNK